MEELSSIPFQLHSTAMNLAIRRKPNRWWDLGVTVSTEKALGHFGTTE
jgi:hypothetical protein